MTKLFFVFCFIVNFCFAQTITQCKYRFDNYLNFKGSLNNRVQFQNDVIYLLNAKGKKETAIYANEIDVLARFLTHNSFVNQQKLLQNKGLKKFTKLQRDSLSAKIIDKRKVVSQDKNLPLKGFRVAIDPGHTAVNLTDAQIEQKFLYFVKDSILNPYDTIKLFESVLTYNTAQLVQKMLEEQGAQVLITRNKHSNNSFNCHYSAWLANNKKRVLDSLKTAKVLPNSKYNSLCKMSDRDLFWEFFRDFDLNNRAKIMNDFNPHVSLIIHYNVDEKNEPWKQVSKKNYTMAFIGGAFTSANLDKPENRIHFLRLLLTDQLDQSEKLAANSVNCSSKNLNIPVASQFDAGYLKDNCLFSGSAGVFCRNLNMCRLINSPLVYGESLYQDNEFECVALMKTDVNYKNIITNDRTLLVAKSYYQAVFDFLKK